MIALDGVVADAELAALAAAAEAGLELAHEATRPQRRDVAADAQRHVGRAAARHFRPLDVMHGRPRGRGLAPRTFPRAAVAAKLHFELIRPLRHILNIAVFLNLTGPSNRCDMECGVFSWWFASRIIETSRSTRMALVGRTLLPDSAWT